MRVQENDSGLNLPNQSDLRGSGSRRRTGKSDHHDPLRQLRQGHPVGDVLNGHVPEGQLPHLPHLSSTLNSPELPRRLGVLVLP